MIWHHLSCIKDKFKTLSLPEPIMKTICSVVLTFESVDKILWFYHSNETSLAVLLHGTISFSIQVYMFFNSTANVTCIYFKGCLEKIPK